MGYVLALWGEFVKFTGGRAGLVHLLLFAAALVCCFFLGKEERHRLFWPSVLVGIFFFNPVFYKYVGTRFLSGVYWRLLWMLPWTFVIAYAVVRMAYRLGKQALRIVVVAVACVCIFVTGKPVDVYKRQLPYRPGGEPGRQQSLFRMGVCKDLGREMPSSQYPGGGAGRRAVCGGDYKKSTGGCGRDV